MIILTYSDGFSITYPNNILPGLIKLKHPEKYLRPVEINITEDISLKIFKKLMYGLHPAKGKLIKDGIDIKVHLKDLLENKDKLNILLGILP